MGACSSKPKTTEFEGSIEPSKEVARSIDAVDVTQSSQQNDNGKEEMAGGAALQEAHEIIASRGEELLRKEALSTEEQVSHSVQVEAGTADEAENKKGETGAGDVQKVDVGVDAADIEGVGNKAITVDKGVGVDQDKLFRDKAVVLDGAGIGGVGEGGTYIDKEVAADEAKARDRGSTTTQDEQPTNLQDINESPGLDSPIIGVIQFADPVYVDVSESVGLANVETPAHVDSPVKVERDVSTGTNSRGDAVTDEATDLLSGSPEGATEEKVEFLHDDSKGRPLLGSDDGVAQERGAKKSGEEVPLVFADVQDEINVEDTTKSETIEDRKNDIDKRQLEPQEGCSPEESTREAHAEVMANEGNAEVINEHEAEALKVDGIVDADTSAEPLAETMLEKAMEGQDQGSVNELNVRDMQPLASATEEWAKDGKLEVTPDEAGAGLSAESEREEKLEKPHVEEASTKEEKVESVDAGNHELSAEQRRHASGECDLMFEDASDVPLKVESSTIAAGDTPST